MNKEETLKEIKRLADSINCYVSLTPKEPRRLTKEQLEYKREFERGSWH